MEGFWLMDVPDLADISQLDIVWDLEKIRFCQICIFIAEKKGTVWTCGDKFKSFNIFTYF